MVCQSTLIPVCFWNSLIAAEAPVYSDIGFQLAMVTVVPRSSLGMEDST